MFTLPTLPAELDASPPEVAESSGFSLHTSIAAKASQRDKIERLSRHVSRPPVATERLSLTEGGLVRLALKTPYRDSNTHVIFEPEDFIAQLAALMLKPRAHFTRYHGMFASASPDRVRIVPRTRTAAGNKRGEPLRIDQQRAMSWAQRIRRVFTIDIETYRRGVAVVSATVLAAARRETPTNVVALAALAEDMPSGSAIRPGDVLTSMSGKTIEINSTDAEGCLVVSDAVHYGQIEYSPETLIDVATLTGSLYRAVGDTYAGLFSRHNELAGRFQDAAAGEPAWRLPLDDIHFKLIESDVADVINGGITGAGASIGASFIGTFVTEEQARAHFDIASMDYIERALPTVPVGFSAWGVRALNKYLRRHRQSAR